jgi:pyruvate dehydrogenase (quinone)
MARTGGEILVEALIEWGVDTVFGLPGDGINGIMEALRARKEKVKFVHVRHEESAAFMACGYAKFTGRLGVCLATSGPGCLHLLNGLYDAKLDGQPVLAVTGHHFHDLIDTSAQQDVNLDRVFADVAVYSTRVMGVAHAENVTHNACRIALTRRGVAHINFPVDFQSLTHDGRSERNLKGHADTIALGRWMALPAEESLKRAADVLNAGKRVAILAGRGALGAADELEQLAEAVAGPVIKALLGKACVPDDSPYTTGGIGLLGTRPSQEAMEECDTLFIVGSSFPYIEFLPKPGKARAVQLDLDGTRIGLRYPVEVSLVGDCQAALRALLPLLKRKKDRSFLKAAQDGMADWNVLMRERATRTDKPMKPQVVAHELGQRLRDDAIVCCDSGTVATWFARHIAARRGQMYSLSGTLASMANGLPYAIAAQVAHPKRQVVAFVGDGAFSMLMGEFATAVQHKLPVKVVVCKNNSLGMIRWEQMVFLGHPQYACDLSPIDFAKVAAACGGDGLSCDDPAEIGGAIDALLRSPGPAVLEAVVDPNEPPMPPKATVKQALHLAEALARGTPDARGIIGTVLENQVREMV